MDPITADKPAEGLLVFQPSRGFRYGAEAFWLAGFALEVMPRARTALDLGTGSGIVAMLLARRGLDVVGIDTQPAWEPLWRRTLAESETDGTVRLLVADARVPQGAFDVAVSNPPFYVSSGPTADDPWLAAARTEGDLGISGFVDAAMNAAPTACLVVPAHRGPDVVRAADGADARIIRRVRIGRSRLAVALARGPGAPAVLEEVEHDSPVCASWYAAAAATP